VRVLSLDFDEVLSSLLGLDPEDTLTFENILIFYIINGSGFYKMWGKFEKFDHSTVLGINMS
jgi:hypothetical protein